MIGAALVVHLRSLARARMLNGGAENPSLFGRKWVVALDREDKVEADVSVVMGGIDLNIDKDTFAVRSDWHPGRRIVTGQINGVPFSVKLEILNEGYRLTRGGAVRDVTVRTPRTAALAAVIPERPPESRSKHLVAPMPGLVVSLAVEPGNEVKPGQVLAVIEAMKMENVLRAEGEGVVSAVCVKPGDTLAVDDVIVEFE
jgi:propionyl-CoA carboxylase alpha chain